MHRLQNAESDWMDVWCRVVSEELLAEVIARVDQAEAEGSITPWEEGDVPASLLEDEPEPGKILSEKEVPVLGGTELTLSNGMKVFSCSLLPQQVHDHNHLSHDLSAFVKQPALCVFGHALLLQHKSGPSMK